MGRGINQHRLIIHDRVTVLGDSIFPRHIINRDRVREHGADNDRSRVGVGPDVFAHHVIVEFRTIFVADAADDCTTGCSNHRTHRSADHRTTDRAGGCAGRGALSEGCSGWQCRGQYGRSGQDPYLHGESPFLLARAYALSGFNPGQP